MEALTTIQASRLAELEKVIEGGVRQFMATGQALMEVRDEKLYRDTLKTFASYCEGRWGFTQQYATQLCRSAEAVGQIEKVKPLVSLPANERQVRPLTQLPEEERGDAWEEAVETAPEGRVTSAHVERVVERRQEAKAEPEAAPQDEVGVVIPKAMRTDFERAADFEQIVRDLQGIKKRCETLAGEDVGRFIHAQSLGADIENAKRAVKFAKPYAVCCYCHGKKATCSACKGGGWLPKTIHEAAPESMK